MLFVGHSDVATFNGPMLRAVKAEMLPSQTLRLVPTVPKWRTFLKKNTTRSIYELWVRLRTLRYGNCEKKLWPVGDV